MILICNHCHKEYKESHPTRKYCSDTCAGIARRTGVTAPCSCCGKEFHVSQSQYDRGYRLCSMACRLEEKEKERIRVCAVCNKKFKVSYPSHNTQTCSYTCSFELRTKGTYNKCEICGKDMWVTPCFSDKKRFCSRVCLGVWHSKTFVGENHPNWAGGVSKYPYPFRWNDNLKSKIKERDGNICKKCGYNETLTIHHIDYEKENLDERNLITLCNTCNIKANYGREHWKSYYQNLMEVLYA